MTYLTEPLNLEHERSGFNCGIEQLDTYIQKISKQDMKRFLTVVHVLTEESSSGVIGYYTLSGLHIPRAVLPEAIIKKLPKGYNELPATLLGRLAIDLKYQGQGLGEELLLDALKRAYDLTQSSIGSMAVVVDPYNAKSKKFYDQYDFIEIPDRDRMFLPMKTIEKIFRVRQ